MLEKYTEIQVKPKADIVNVSNKNVEKADSPFKLVQYTAIPLQNAAFHVHH